MSTTVYKVQAVWSIKKETIMNLKNLKKISSERFDTTLPNVQYSINIYKWCCPKNGNIIPIYVQCHDKIIQRNDNNDSDNDSDTDDGCRDYSENIWIEKLDLFISSANFQKNFNRRQTLDCAKYLDPFDLEELLNPDNKYFVNDILTLEIRGILKYKKNEFNWETLWEKNDKDFKFFVGNGTFKAHKLIVCHFSSVFAAAMDSGEFKIENFDVGTVDDALQLCYGRKPYCNSCKADYFPWLRVNSLYKLIEFTNVYDMPLIKEQIENEFEELIHAQNVCELANKSLELNAEILRSFCVNFLSDCIKNGKPFKGTLNDLKPELIALVFKSSFCHTQTS